MSTLRHSPSPRFRDRVEAEDLQLRGVRARALQFEEGTHDPARAVVCIAGMGADGRSFVRQRPLSSRWFTLMLNIPSDTPTDEDPLQFSADVVEEFLDAERLDRPVLLGSSFGGAVAAVVALRRQERLRALVLPNAVLSRWQIPLAFKGFIDLLEAPPTLATLVAPIAAQVMGGFTLDAEARDEIVREARQFSGTELKRRLHSLRQLDLFPKLATLKLPTLFVHGKRDLLVPWRRGRKAAQLVPGSEFLLIDKAGHLPYLSHAEVFNARLLQFLDKVWEGDDVAAA